jgi:hypothetical protein
VALYLEDEYEKLAMEAHFDCQWLDNLIYNGPSFLCRFCKVCMKDNIIFFSQSDELVPTYKGKNIHNLRFQKVVIYPLKFISYE